MRGRHGLVLAGVVIAVGCSPVRNPPPTPTHALRPLASRSVVGLPAASYAGVAVTSELVVASRSLITETGGSLVVRSPHLPGEQIIGPDRDQSCEYQDLLYPVSLEQGQIAILGLCARRGTGDLVSPDLYSLEILAPDGDRRHVVRSGEASPSMPLGPFDYSDRFGVLIGVGDGLCGTVALWTTEGFRPLNVDAVSPTGTRLSLDTLALTRDTCGGLGVAGWPAWLEDGRIAFLAAPDAALHQSFDRLDAPSYVFVAHRNDEEARLLWPCGITHARALTILPGGRHAIVSGTLGSLGSGTWLLKLGSPGVMLISRTDFAWIAADERSVFGLDETIDSTATLAEYELPEDLASWISCQSGT